MGVKVQPRILPVRGRERVEKREMLKVNKKKKEKKEIQETVSEEEERILSALILMLNKVCLF